MAKIPDGAYSTSQYARNLSLYKAKEDKLTYWENLLQPAASQYQAELQSANLQKGYDITGAYQNFLNYQTQLATSNLLGTSKNKLASEAESAYESSYAKALSDYYKSIESSTSTYNKAVEKSRESLYEEAANLKSIDERLKSYIEDNYENLGYTSEDISNMFQRKSTGEMELTDLGKNIYASVLDSIYTSDPKSEYYGKNVFLTDLSTTDSKLYDYAVENQEKLRQVLAGYSEKDYDYTKYTPDKYDYEINMSKEDENYYKEKLNLDVVGKSSLDRYGNLNWLKNLFYTDDYGTIYFNNNRYDSKSLKANEAKELLKKANIKTDKIKDLPQDTIFQVDGGYYIRHGDLIYSLGKKKPTKVE